VRLRNKPHKLLYIPLLRRATPKKLFNLYRQSRELAKKTPKVKSYPSIAIIDPANICNLRCLFCPTGRGLQKERGYMDIGLFRKIMDEISPYLFEVWLFNWGEPLMSPGIFEMVEIADRKNVSTTISTNLNRLPEGHEDELVLSGLERLVVSFDGMTQKSYSYYRIGGNLENVVANVLRIVDAKKRHSRPLPFVKLQFLVHRNNEHEIEEARAFAQEHGLDIEFKPLMFNARDPELRGKWEPTLSGYVRYDKDGNDLSSRKYKCPFLWKYLTVTFDGTVTPCCHWIEKGLFDFGNLRDRSFREIWNNDQFVSARKVMSSDRSGQVNACHSCLGQPPVFS